MDALLSKDSRLALDPDMAILLIRLVELVVLPGGRGVGRGRGAEGGREGGLSEIERPGRGLSFAAPTP
jgi:hypothetical protein